MKFFFSRRLPEFSRLLLVESGSRSILDNLLPGLFALYGDQLHVDLVTCFAGEPAGWRPSGHIFRVWEYATPAARRQLLRTLRANRYTACGIICSGEPIMTKWKWWLAVRLPAKVFVLNENGDYYWFDYSNWRTMLHFVFFRLGLTGADAVTTIARLLLFPLTFCYLLLYASLVHLRRRVRT